MLIPLRHENMRGRRWPIITFALIGLNTLIFLLTHWTIEAQQPKRTEARVHLLILAAAHPELKTTPEAAEFVERTKKAMGNYWNQVASPNRRVEDSWDAQIRFQDDPVKLQEEMDTICQQFEEAEHDSLLEKYGFVPAHPTAVSYLSANFLHGGWLHLIGNMWFLWLAGFILEDNWGRLIYTIFYLVSGMASLQFYAWCSHGSFTPLVGASGAVAALMGAFLVRFPKIKIEMALVSLFYRFKFKAAAYWLLPLSGCLWNSFMERPWVKTLLLPTGPTLAASCSACSGPLPLRRAALNKKPAPKSTRKSGGPATPKSCARRTRWTKAR